MDRAEPARGGPVVIAAAAVEQDVCRNCGREWPARFGDHRCNMHAAYVHNRAIVVDPGADLLDTLRQLTERLDREICSAAEGADLAGEDSPYRHYLGRIDASIGLLKRFRRDVQGLSKHAHEWNESDYCSICGADGRA